MRAPPWSASVLVAVLLAAAACSTGPEAAEPAATGLGTGAPTTSASPAGALKAAPRWEPVATLNDTAPGAGPVSIAPGAIQWRARWTCATGAIRIETTPAPAKPKPVVDAACPGTGTGFSIQTGDLRLAVAAAAPWEVVVEQQVDTPLEEPLLPGMESAPVVLTGSFYDVEKEGQGSASVFQLGGGRRVLRLQDFHVSQNSDLFVWLSESVAPATSRDTIALPHVTLAELKSTAGNQNYDIPVDVPLEKIRSVVIWCQPLAVVYSVAALTA